MDIPRRPPPLCELMPGGPERGAHLAPCRAGAAIKPFPPFALATSPEPSVERPRPVAGLPDLPQTALIKCPKSMVGRVIGKGGETIKALQQFTGAVIQIDQSQDPTRVSIAGDLAHVQLAANMIQDIVDGHFKGFAMLRQLGARAPERDPFPAVDAPARPVYVQGYGFVPPSQFSASDSDESSRTDLSASFSPHTPAKSYLDPLSTTPSSPSTDSTFLGLAGSLAPSPSGLDLFARHAALFGQGGPCLTGHPDPFAAPLAPLARRGLGAAFPLALDPHAPHTPPQQLPPAMDDLWQYAALSQGVPAGLHMAPAGALPITGAPVSRALFRDAGLLGGLDAGLTPPAWPLGAAPLPAHRWAGEPTAW